MTLLRKAEKTRRGCGFALSAKSEQHQALSCSAKARSTSSRNSSVSLMRIAKLKLAARSLGVRRLDLGPQGGSVLFEERTAVDPASLVRLIQKSAREYRLDGPRKLRISRPMPTDQARFEYAGELLGRLGAAARPRPPG